MVTLTVVVMVGDGGGSGMTLREMSLVKQCQTREHLEKVARVHPSSDRELASECTFHIISARVSSTIINVLSIYHRDPRVACPRGLCMHFDYMYINASIPAEKTTVSSRKRIERDRRL